MSDPQCSASSYDGTIRIYDDHVEVESSTLLGDAPVQSIPLEAIGTVEYREPKLVRGGYVKFLTNSRGGTWDVKGEYTVRFQQDAEAFERVRDAVQNGASSGVGGEDGPLEILEERYARGEISHEEFEKRRDALQG